tara:strand:+ start:1154 stop:1660 length:507 start_codon:yes stop_codon:yes gene_type:complete
MANYSKEEIAKMQMLADNQGITLAEITKRRNLDEEFSTYVDPRSENARQERLGLKTATVSEFEPVLGSAPGVKGVAHQDTSHIGAEERATGKAVGSTAGTLIGTLLGGPVGGAIGGAAGGAVGGGGSFKESAIATAGGAGDAYAKEVSKGKDGKTVGDMMTKIKGVLN